MKKLQARTASVLLTDVELHAIAHDRLRLIYRPLSLHWDHMLSKFKQPKQSTLVGFESQDIVHLMKDTGRYDVDTERPIIVKVESRVIRRIHDVAVFPEDYQIRHEDLLPMDPCWLIVLGHKVG